METKSRNLDFPKDGTLVPWDLMRQQYVCGNNKTPSVNRCGFQVYKEFAEYVNVRCGGQDPICLCNNKHPKVYVETIPNNQWGCVVMHCENGNEPWHKKRVEKAGSGYISYTIISNRHPIVDKAYNDEVRPNVRRQEEERRARRGE